jgi:hypothetical protein
MRRSTKKLLKKTASSATIWLKNVAGLVMQGLKKIWSNYQWVLALVALLYGIFLFYYNSTQATPARVTALEQKFSSHVAETDVRLKKIESDQNDIRLTLAELNTKMDISLLDLSIMKGYITGEAHHK